MQPILFQRKAGCIHIGLAFHISGHSERKQANGPCGCLRLAVLTVNYRLGRRGTCVLQDGILTATSRTPGRPGPLRPAHFPFPTPHHVSDDNSLCVSHPLFFLKINFSLNYCLALSNLKTGRMKPDVSLGGRTFYRGVNSVLSLTQAVLLHESSSYHICQRPGQSFQPVPARQGVQTARHLDVGKGSVSSLPSTGQDLEEGFAELHVEGGIDHGVQGTVHVA